MPRCEKEMHNAATLGCVRNAVARVTSWTDLQSFMALSAKAIL